MVFICGCRLVGVEDGGDVEVLGREEEGGRCERRKWEIGLGQLLWMRC